MSDLPPGWADAKLEHVAEWGSGGTPSRSRADYYGGTIPWIKTGELGQGLITDTEEKITEEALDNSSAKVFPKGSVAIAMYGATIGKVATLGIDAATNQACAVGIPFPRVTTTRYLLHYLASQKAEFVAKGQGGAQPNISQTIIKNWPIPLAPFREQERIAEKLDLVLTRVDDCHERLDRVPQILKKFREAVLEAAVSGRLTEEWRAKNPGKSGWAAFLGQTPPEIPEHYERLSKQAFQVVKVGHSADSLPHSWTVCTIADLYGSKALIDFADGNHGSMYPRKEDFGAHGAIFLTAQQIDESHKVDLAGCHRLRAEKASRLTKGWALDGDVLLTHNATVGRVALLEGAGEPVLLGTSVTFYRFNANYVDARFARAVFSSRFFQMQLESVMEQTTRSQVPITKQVSLHFVCPPITEQREIARRVDELFALADSLHHRYQDAAAATEKLAPSVLAKAFRGALVPQDPNDAPAGEMLKRIRLSESGSRSKPGKHLETAQP